MTLQIFNATNNQIEMGLKEGLTNHVKLDVVAQLLILVVIGGCAEVSSKVGGESGHHRSNALCFASLGSVVDIKAHEHGVFQRKFESPRLASQLGIHLDNDFGGDGHDNLVGDILGQEALTQD